MTESWTSWKSRLSRITNYYKHSSPKNDDELIHSLSFPLKDILINEISSENQIRYFKGFCKKLRLYVFMDQPIDLSVLDASLTNCEVILRENPYFYQVDLIRVLDPNPLFRLIEVVAFPWPTTVDGNGNTVRQDLSWIPIPTHTINRKEFYTKY